MTLLDVLQAVFEKGERCRECEFHYAEHEFDRLSGRMTKVVVWRGCDVINSQNYRFAHDPLDCPGVEDELAKAEGECSE